MITRSSDGTDREGRVEPEEGERFRVSRNLLFLNSMPFEMLVEQKRLWEVETRDLGGYCKVACSIFFNSKSERTVQIKPDRNIVYCLPSPAEQIRSRWIRYPARLIFALKLFRRIRKICRSHRIDAIVSQSNGLKELELGAIAAARAQRIPILGYIGRNPQGLTIGRYRRIAEIPVQSRNPVVHLERFILGQFDRVVMRPGTEKLLCHLFTIDPAEVVSIPHKIKFDQFIGEAEIPAAIAKWMEPRRTILTWGRLSPEKFMIDMVRALPKVDDSGKSPGLLIIGDGPQRAELEGLVAELGLEDSVRIEGFLPQDVICAIAEESDVLLQLTGGKSFFEAALTSKPVVTYDLEIGMFFGLAEDHTTLSVEVGNTAELAHAISRLLEDRDLAHRLAGRMQEAAKKHNDWSDTDRKLAQAVENEIMKKRRGVTPMREDAELREGRRDV